MDESFNEYWIREASNKWKGDDFHCEEIKSSEMVKEIRYFRSNPKKKFYNYYFLKMEITNYLSPSGGESGWKYILFLYLGIHNLVNNKPLRVERDIQIINNFIEENESKFLKERV